MTKPDRAHDCLINVHFGDEDQPEWMHRVKNEYFKRGDSIFGKWEMEKVLAEMDENGVERAVLSASLREPKSSAIRFVEARPDRFALSVGGLDLLRPMPSLRELEAFVRSLPVVSAVVLVSAASGRERSCSRSMPTVAVRHNATHTMSALWLMEKSMLVCG